MSQCFVLRYEKIKTSAHQENVLTLEDLTWRKKTTRF